MRTCSECPNLISTLCTTGLCRTCYWRIRERRRRGLEGVGHRKQEIGEKEEKSKPRPVRECCGSLEYHHRPGCRFYVKYAADPTRSVPECYICRLASGRHAPGCHFSRKAVQHVPRKAKQVMRYICGNGHRFASNLAVQDAVCPDCGNRKASTDKDPEISFNRAE